MWTLLHGWAGGTKSSRRLTPGTSLCFQKTPSCGGVFRAQGACHHEKAQEATARAGATDASERRLCNGKHPSNTPQAFAPFIPTSLGGQYFTDGETEAQGGYITCSRSPNKKQNLDWIPGSLAPELLQPFAYSWEGSGFFLSYKLSPKPHPRGLGGGGHWQSVKALPALGTGR